MRTAIASEGLKASPPVVVTAAVVSGGWTVNEWVGLATLCYIIVQTTYLVWKWRKEYKASRP